MAYARKARFEAAKQARAALLSAPRGAAVNRNGNVFIADTGNDRVSMVGSSSASQEVTLTNSGEGVLHLTSILVSGANELSFVFEKNCPATLNPGGGCKMHGRFAPAAKGAVTTPATLH